MVLLKIDAGGRQKCSREIPVSENVFVGREAELGTLKRFLASAASGQGQVVLIAGEAGAGKTALVTEFVRRAEQADAHLVAAIGECNAQTGAGDPYLPFRELLTVLTGTQDENQASGSVNPENSSRLRQLVHVSGSALLEVGPDLIGIFVPGTTLLAKLASSVVKHSEMLPKLEKRLGKPEQPKQGPAVNPELDQDRIFQQYTAVLRTLAKDQTLILILDDLQWSDGGSLNLLFHLARKLSDSRVLLVGTYRSDDVALGRGGERHPLETVVNELKRYNGDIVIDLSRSRADEELTFVNDLVDSEPNRLGPAFRQELCARTDGHPLFTIELLRHLQERGDLVRDGEGRWVEGPALDWDALPARVEGVIEERLARLPDDMRETLNIGSVMGYDFTAQVVAQVQQVQERDLLRNLSRDLDKRHHLIQEEGEIRIGKQILSLYRFAHALFQQFLYNDLSAGERRLMHGDVAAALEQLYQGHTSEIAVPLAHHYDQAGDDDKAIGYLIEAGDAAFRVYAQKEALAYYARALELAKETDVPAEQLAHLYTRRGRAFELSGQVEQALQNYDEMSAAAGARYDRHMELGARLASSTLYSTPTTAGDAVKAERLSHESLALARELGDRAGEAKALWNLLLVNMYLEANPQQAVAYGEEALAIARQSGLQEQSAFIVGDLAYAYTLAGRLDEANEKFAEANGLWQDLGNLAMLASSLNRSVIPLVSRGQYEKGLLVAEESLKISRSIDNRWNQGAPLILEAVVWLDYGEFAKAVSALEESFRLAGEVNARFLRAMAHGILLWLRTSLTASHVTPQAYQDLRTPNADIPPSPLRLWTLSVFALCDIAGGAIDMAAETVKNVTTDAGVDPASPAFASYHLVQTQIALARGDSDKAIAISDRLIDHMHTFGMRPYLADILLVKGRAQLATGDRQSARETFTQARSEAETLGSRRNLWQILLALAETTDDQAEAAALRAQAGEIVAFIAEHAGSSDLRAAFLDLPQVQALRIAVGH